MLCGALALLPLPLSSRAAEPRTVRTDAGVYELVIVPNQQAPFELTEDRMFGVRAVTPGASRETTFESFAVDQPGQVLASQTFVGLSDWCVVGQQVFVAAAGRLSIHRLPTLEVERQLTLDEPRPETYKSSAPVQLTLAAAVNADQDIIYVTGREPLSLLTTPFTLQIGSESMVVNSVDILQDSVRVTRSEGQSHSVSSPVVAYSGLPEEPIMRVPGGWLCRGYVYDDQGRIQAVLLPRDLPYAELWTVQLRATYGNVPGGGRGGGLPQHRHQRELASFPWEWAAASAALASPAGNTSDQPMPAGPLIMTVIGEGEDYAGKPVERIPLNTIYPFTRHFSAVRSEGRNCSIVVDATGVHLRVVEFDGEVLDIPSPQRFRLHQPTHLFDELRPDVVYTFQEGRQTLPVVTTLAGGKPLDDREQLARHVRRVVLGSEVVSLFDLSELQLVLKDYEPAARREFARITGRNPTGIPIAIPIETRTNWRKDQAAVRSFHYWVWKEWSELELLELICPELLAADTSAAFAKQREAARQREAERQRQLDLEREQAAAAQREQQRQRREAELRASLRQRNWLALGVVLSGVVAMALLAVRRRHTEYTI